MYEYRLSCNFYSIQAILESINYLSLLNLKRKRFFYNAKSLFIQKIIYTFSSSNSTSKYFYVFQNFSFTTRDNELRYIFTLGDEFKKKKKEKTLVEKYNFSTSEYLEYERKLFNCQR